MIHSLVYISVNQRLSENYDINACHLFLPHHEDMYTIVHAWIESYLTWLAILLWQETFLEDGRSTIKLESKKGFMLVGNCTTSLSRSNSRFVIRSRSMNYSKKSKILCKSFNSSHLFMTRMTLFLFFLQFILLTLHCDRFKNLLGYIEFPRWFFCTEVINFTGQCLPSSRSQRWFNN